MKPARVESRLLLLVTFGLVSFGLVMVYSATSASAALRDGDPAYYLKRQVIYAAIGLVLMFVFARLEFRDWRRLAPVLILTSLALLVGVLGIGQAVNGARRWITVGPVVFQPSELAKLAVAVWAAAHLARRKPPRTLRDLWRPLGLLTGVFCALLLAEPDLGTTIVLILVLAGMLLVAGTPVRTLLGSLTIATTLGLAAIWFEPYRRARIFSFLNPWQDAQGAGFQTVQAMIGLGSGGVFGAGLGQSVEKANYLPEARTDMIFAVIGEELGLVGTTALMAAYAAFAYTGLRIAIHCKDPFGKALASGVTVLVCGQAALNIAAVMGLAPLTGVPLPFVSYGGSSLVIALAGVGILLNIAGDGRQARAKVPDRGRGDGRPRDAVARRRRSAWGARSAGELRRLAESHRSSARS